MRESVPAAGTKAQRRLKDIFGLWDALSDLGAGESDAATRLCMEQLCGWIGAQDAFWVGIVNIDGRPARDQTDLLKGWRIRAIVPLYDQYHDAEHNKKLVKATLSKPDPGATNIALAAGVGMFRAYTLQSGDLVDVESFQKTEHYDFYYRQRGVVDRIWVAFPVDADAESVFCFDRIGDQPHFDQDDLDLAAFTLRGVKWFHHKVLLSHCLGLCTDQLTPSERRVIQGLLSGASEKEIAADMNLSQGTVHQYATRIYRKFGARGRAEFTAIWLEGAG